MYAGGFKFNHIKLATPVRKDKDTLSTKMDIRFDG